MIIYTSYGFSVFLFSLGILFLLVFEERCRRDEDPPTIMYLGLSMLLLFLSLISFLVVSSTKEDLLQETLKIRDQKACSTPEELSSYPFVFREEGLVILNPVAIPKQSPEKQK